jgi:hypothetical protein
MDLPPKLGVGVNVLSHGYSLGEIQVCSRTALAKPRRRLRSTAPS